MKGFSMVFSMADGGAIVISEMLSPRRKTTD